MLSMTTGVSRRVEPAQVLHVAGVAPEDVPLYLAELDDAALVRVAQLAQGLLTYVNEVCSHRRCAALWESAGRQLAVGREPLAHELSTLWGDAPKWPAADQPAAPAAEVDPDSTQVIPSGAIRTAMGMFGPLVEPTAAADPEPRGPRPEPAVLDPAELDHTISPDPDPVSNGVDRNPAETPAETPVAVGVTGPAVTVSPSGSVDVGTVTWYPTPAEDEDWSAAPPDDSAELPEPPTLPPTTEETP